LSRVQSEDEILVACEGISCRYNEAPKEDDVSGVDDNLFRHDFCIPDVSGLFGSDQGQEQYIEYFYQVETQPTTTIDDLNTLLGKLETSVSRTIMPELFSDQCAPISRMRRKREPKRRLEVMGVSSKPPDKVLDGGRFDRF
jgi:hypothetical protein